MWTYTGNGLEAILRATGDKPTFWKGAASFDGCSMESAVASLLGGGPTAAVGGGAS